MTELPTLTLEWLTKLFEDNIRTGKKVSAVKIAEVHAQLSVLVTIYAKSADTHRDDGYPAHAASEALHKLIDKASLRWGEKSAADPANQLPKNATQALGDLSRLLRESLWYVELPPPPVSIQVAGNKVRIRSNKARDLLVVQVADLLRDTLQPLSNRAIGSNKDGPVVRMTAEVMKVAHWQMTNIAVSRALDRLVRTKSG